MKRQAGGTNDDLELAVDSAGGGGGDVNLTEVGGAAIALGQAAMAASLPVVVASNQTAIPVSLASAPTTSVTQGTSPWVVSAGSLPLPTGAATLAEQQTQTTALQIIDDWDESDRAKVNLIVGQAGIAAGTGVDGATVPRVTLATNVALPAGTNAIGKLAANSGVDIGDVDVTSVGGNVTVVQPTGTNLHAVLDSGSTTAVTYATTGSGTATGAIRVELPTNGTGVIATVGAVTAITNALPAGTNGIGKLTANSGVDIGDVDVTSVVPGTGATNLGKAEDGGHTSADVGVFALAVRQDTPNTAVTGATARYSQMSVSSTGAARNAPMSEDFAALANGPQVKKYYTSAGAVTDGIVWSPAAGTRWYVTDLILSVSAACTVTFEDDKAGGDETVAKFEFAANSGLSHPFNTPWFSGEDAADLLVTTSAGNIYITITGYEI